MDRVNMYDSPAITGFLSSNGLSNISRCIDRRVDELDPASGMYWALFSELYKLRQLEFVLGDGDTITLSLGQASEIMELIDRTSHRLLDDPDAS